MNIIQPDYICLYPNTVVCQNFLNGGRNSGRQKCPTPQKIIIWPMALGVVDILVFFCLQYIPHSSGHRTSVFLCRNNSSHTYNPVRFRCVFCQSWFQEGSCDSCPANQSHVFLVLCDWFRMSKSPKWGQSGPRSILGLLLESWQASNHM